MKHTLLNLSFYALGIGFIAVGFWGSIWEIWKELRRGRRQDKRIRNLNTLQKGRK